MNSCIGCGEKKQLKSQNLKGFVKKEEDIYCLRCFRIKNYNDLIEQEIEAKEFENIIKNQISKTKEMKTFYYVLDILDLQGSRTLELEKIIKNHNVVLVINKIDLLPKAVKLSKVRSYVKKVFNKSEIKDPQMILTNIYNQNLLFSLINTIAKKNREQYFVGQSNGGKSSLLNALMKCNKLIPNVVSSKFFNTTLNIIEVGLSPNAKIYDTPGIKKEGSIAEITEINQWKYFYFNHEMKQTTFQTKSNNSIIFGNLCWVSYESPEQEQNISLHFYTNPLINLHRSKFDNEINFINKNKFEPVVKDEKWFQNLFQKDFTFNPNEIGKKMDIVISGLGWFSFTVGEDTKFSVSIPNGENISIYKREALI